MEGLKTAMEIFNPHSKIIKAFPFYPFGLFINQGSRSDAFGYLENQDNPACRQCQRKWEEGICIPLQEICGHVKCRQCFIKQSISLDRSCPQCLKCCPECKLVWNQDDHTPVQEICGHFRCRSCVVKMDQGLASCPQCSTENHSMEMQVVERPSLPKRRGRPPKNIYIEAPPSVSTSSALPKLLSAVIKPQQIVAPCKAEETDVQKIEGSPQEEAASGAKYSLVPDEHFISAPASPVEMDDTNSMDFVVPSLSENRSGEIDVQTLTERLAPRTVTTINDLPGFTCQASVIIDKSMGCSTRQEEITGSVAVQSLNNISSLVTEPKAVSMRLTNFGALKSEEVPFPTEYADQDLQQPDEFGMELDNDGRSQQTETPVKLKIKLNKVHTEIDVIEGIVIKAEETLRPPLPDCIKIIENDKADEKYQCQKCNTVYESELGSDKPLEMFLCNLCGEISAEERTRHAEMSMKPKYKCTICSSRFHHLVKFNQHLRSHSGGRLPLTCFKCCQGFIERSELEKHSCCLKNKPVLKCSRCSNLYCDRQSNTSYLKNPKVSSCDCTEWASTLKLQIKSNNKCKTKSTSSFARDENSVPSCTKTMQLTKTSLAVRSTNKKLKGPKSRRVVNQKAQEPKDVAMQQKKPAPEKVMQMEELDLFEIESHDESTELVESDSDEEYIPNKRRRRKSVLKQAELKDKNAIEVEHSVREFHGSNSSQRAVTVETKPSVPEFVNIIENADASSNFYQCTHCHTEYDSEFKRKMQPQFLACTFCGELTEEVKQHPEAKKKPKYECTVCKSRFHQIAELTQHLRQKHTHDRMPFICSKCGQGHITRTDLDVHVCAFKDDKLLRCSSCSSKYIGRAGTSAAAKGGPLYSDVPPTLKDSPLCPCTEWAKTQQCKSNQMNEDISRSSSPTDGLKRIAHINGTQVNKSQPFRTISDLKKLITNQLNMPTKAEVRKSVPSSKRETKKITEDVSMPKRKVGRPPGTKNAQTKVQKLKQTETNIATPNIWEHITVLTEGADTFYKCTKCNQKFSSKRYAYFNHKYHCPSRNQEEDYFECDICGENFSDENDLLIHSDLHLIRSPTEECQICGSTFDTVPLLKEHMETHKSFSEIVEVTASVSEVKRYVPVSTWMKQLRETMPMQIEQQLVHAAQSGNSRTQSPAGSSINSVEENNSIAEVLSTVEDPIVSMETVETNNGVCDAPEVLKDTLNFNVNECPRCEESFHDQMSFCRHYFAKHAFDSPFDCFLCEEKYQVLQDLRDHLLLQHREALRMLFPADRVPQEIAYNDQC